MKQGYIHSLSACIIKNDDIVWAEGYGKYDISSDLIADTDTIYMSILTIYMIINIKNLFLKYWKYQTFLY